MLTTDKDYEVVDQSDCIDTHSASILVSTQNKLLNHFQSSEWSEICKIMANEVDVVKAPVSQIMTDIFHKSMEERSKFVRNSSLSSPQTNDIKQLAESFQLYQSRFTSSIYAPLHKYLPSTTTKFEGNANDLLLRISEVVNMAKKQPLMKNCGIQFDLRYIAKMATNSSRRSNVHLINDKEDTMDDIISSAPDSVVSDILRNAKISTIDSTKPESFSRILQSTLTKECDSMSESHYSRYEILMDDTNMIKIFPAIQNNTIPAVDIANTPLCPIYNSTNSVQTILDYLAATKHQEISHMMTFSIHFYHGLIEIYFYIHTNGKLYGSRMFEDDLLQIIPKLFEDDAVKHAKSIHDNFSLDNLGHDIQFNHPTKYQQYESILYGKLDSVDINTALDDVCTSCPAGDGAANKHDVNNKDNNFSVRGNNDNHSNFSHNKSDNHQNRDNENNGNNDDNKDGDKSQNEVYQSNAYLSESCNHLDKCWQCEAVIHEQQNNHAAFVKSIEETIQNKSNVTKSKSKPTKSKRKESVNEVSYNPNISRLVGGRIFISRKLTSNIIPNRIKETPSNVYQHVLKTIAIGLQRINDTNDDQKVDENIILNLGLHDKSSGNVLYVKLEKNRTGSSHSHQIADQLFTALDLASTSPLPILPAIDVGIKEEMNLITDKLHHSEKFKWKNIPIFRNKSKNINKQRLTLAIDANTMNDLIKARFSQKAHLKLIPILLFDNKSYRIEYIFSIYFEKYGSIGISIKADKEKGIKICGIHLDVAMLQIHHHLAMSSHHINECHCFDGLDSVIDDIHIGNPDHWQNIAKDFQGRYIKERDTLHEIEDLINQHIQQQYIERPPDFETGAVCISSDPLSSIADDGSLFLPTVDMKIDIMRPINESITKQKDDIITQRNKVTSLSSLIKPFSHGDISINPFKGKIAPMIRCGSNLQISDQKRKNQQLLNTVQQKNDIIKQKDNIISEQKSEIEDLRQRIEVLPSQIPSKFIDMTDDLSFCDTGNDSDYQCDLDQIVIQNEIDAGFISDYSLDSVDINNILDAVCISCPAGYGSSNNSNHCHGNNNNNNFGNDSNNNHHSNFSRNKRNNRQNRKNNGNNNNNDDNKDGNDDDKFHHNPYSHEKCNHLYECAECNKILIQKDYEMMLLYESIKNLQREVMPEMDGKKGFNPKPNPKSKQSPINLVSYEPIQPPPAKRYVEIPHNLTNTTLPNTAVEGIFNWFDYMRKTVSIQLHDQGMGIANDDEKKSDDIEILINLDLHHHQSKLSLFVKINKIYNHKRFAYRMEDELFTSLDLSEHSLPKSSRDKFEIKKEMEQITEYLKQQENLDELFKNCKWNKIPLHKAKKKKNKQRMVFSITEQELKSTIKLYLSYYEIRLIPILMFSNQSHHIEYIFVIDSCKFGAIGFSVKFDPSNHPKICGIHVDWDRIKLQHQVVNAQHVKECRCLSGLQANVDEFYVRNPDHWDNIIKDKQKRYDALLDKLWSIKAKMQKIMSGIELKEEVDDSPLSSNTNQEIQENIQSSQSSQNSLNNYNSSNSSPSSSVSLRLNGCDLSNGSTEKATNKNARHVIFNDTLPTELGSTKRVNMEHLIEMDEKQIMDLVENICSSSDRLLPHKPAFIQWLDENNIIGSSLMKFNSKRFGQEIVSYFNNKILRGPAVYLFYQIKKYNARQT